VSVPAASLRTKATVNGGLAVGLKRVLGPDHRMGYLFIAPMVVLVLSLVLVSPSVLVAERVSPMSMTQALASRPVTVRKAKFFNMAVSP
jgi:hypothetical protein